MTVSTSETRTGYQQAALNFLAARSRETADAFVKEIHTYLDTNGTDTEEGENLMYLYDDMTTALKYAGEDDYLEAAQDAAEDINKNNN